MNKPDDIPEPNSEETPKAAAEYIASFVDELAQLAQRNGLDTLVYILSMARLEADQVAKDSDQPRSYPRSLPPRTTN